MPCVPNTVLKRLKSLYLLAESAILLTELLHLLIEMLSQHRECASLSRQPVVVLVALSLTSLRLRHLVLDPRQVLPKPRDGIVAVGPTSGLYVLFAVKTGFSTVKHCERWSR